MLARFREAVEQSLARHKKQRFHRPSQRYKRSQPDVSGHSQFRRMSTQIEIAALGGGGSVGSPINDYFDDLDNEEEDLEVRMIINDCMPGEY